jgi:GrpE
VAERVEGAAEADPRRVTAERASDQASRKARILEAFEAWLDDALASDAAPEGLLPPEAASEPEGAPAPDLYALWSSLTVLAQETKLQGRAFKQVSEALQPLVDQQRRVLDAHDEALREARRAADLAQTLVDREERRAAREAEERARREAFDVLFDLRDRLQRAVASAQGLLEEARSLPQRRGLLVRLVRFGEAETHALEAVAALEKGVRLTLERLEDALEEMGVREVDCLGEAFDPLSMRAVDVEVAADEDDGAVVEVFRAGYEWNGVLLRPAEVRVARAPERTEG